ncbi:hypothetical protein KW849_18880 [Pseudomonas sp. PDM26]|uniref:hypothetical protein n=1 Tax=Pseudomonas sp. PDM26 TaxID=2854766 RepID=UPI001C43687A|nr:hypothetical protein [Pseudomonas sp. PDM26]MBV7548350.1 hypothetical protein [Pseudomonas sp. PDM26]
MENFEVSLKEANRLIDSALKVGVLLLVIGFVISVGLYLKTFDGGLSSNANDWSALGSFFGGVFGPIISAVTLIALLKTLRLQHQTLMSQKKDSERVIALQNQAYQAQADQLEIANAELRSAKVADFKNSVIRVFEQRIAYYQHSQSDSLNRINTIRSLGETRHALDSIASIGEKSALYKKELEKLLRVSLIFAVKDFDSIEEAKNYVASLGIQTPAV